MATVRIYQPCKTAMQSGKGQTKAWVVEFETPDPFLADPLMGWISSFDMRQELHLSFPSLKEALHFAKTRDLHVTICTPPKVSVVPKSYGMNFTCSRMRGL